MSLPVKTRWFASAVFCALFFTLSGSRLYSADHPIPDPVLTGLESTGKIRASADSLSKLLAQAKPTFSWDVSGEPCLMWIRESSTNGPVFELERAFVHQNRDGKKQWVLVDTQDERVLEQLGGPEFIRDTARVVARQPNPTHDGGGAGCYATVIGSHPKYGTIYEVGWESLMGRGTGHPVSQMRLYVLKDGSGHWRFIGEGPSEDFGKAGGTCGGTKVTNQVIWKADSPLGVKISFTICDWQTECHELDPNQTPLRDRTEYQAAVLDGKSTRFQKIKPPYLLAESGETFDSMVHHLSTWTIGWDSDGADSKRKKIEGLWRKELLRLNPGLSTNTIAKGTKIYVLTYSEITDRLW